MKVLALPVRIKQTSLIIDPRKYTTDKTMEVLVIGARIKQE